MRAIVAASSSVNGSICRTAPSTPARSTLSRAAAGDMPVSTAFESISAQRSMHHDGAFASHPPLDDVRAGFDSEARLPLLEQLVRQEPPAGLRAQHPTGTADCDVDRKDLDVSPIVRRQDELVALLPAEQVAQAIGQAHLSSRTQGDGLGGEGGLRDGPHGVNVSRFPPIARRRVESRRFSFPAVEVRWTHPVVFAW
jgi:hypothetical protein